MSDHKLTTAKQMGAIYRAAIREAESQAEVAFIAFALLDELETHRQDIRDHGRWPPRVYEAEDIVALARQQLPWVPDEPQEDNLIQLPLPIDEDRQQAFQFDE